MRPPLAFGIGLFAALASAQAAPATPDARVNAFLSIWANNATVTPDAVERVYARRVIYYGKPMTAGEVYRDKRAFVRHWPSRTYRVVPGSVAKTCDRDETRCRVTAVLSWRRDNASGGTGQEGANTLTLDLIREDGTLKVAREGGTPVVHADCRDGAGNLVCSGYR